MCDELSNVLANFDGKGYVIAPAGFGKTHLIAKSVGVATRRQLVLTHTYAGVNAIRKKMQLLNIHSSLYQIDTIASWALRMCTFYPKTSQWEKEHPEAADWEKLYSACAEMLRKSFVQHIIKCSYGGVYVDEYQDCSRHQHDLVERLADLIPCRLLGDPMQAIFGFNEQPIDWEKHIYPSFQMLGELNKPWRWHSAGAEKLGDWLSRARETLENNKKISLTEQLPEGVKIHRVNISDFNDRKRLQVFFDFLDTEDSVIAIYSGDQRSKNKAHKLAQALAGRFSSLEEVEGKDIQRFIKKVDGATSPNERLSYLVEFSKKCFNSMSSFLPASTQRGEESKVTKATKCPSILLAANRYFATGSGPDMASFLLSIRDQSGVTTYRRDLLNRMIGILQTYNGNPEITLSEASKQYQRTFRYSGRPIRHNKLIGTTLLVKGLEYSHAIVLEPESMSPQDLYVAITRGAKSVTIVTTKNLIPNQS